MTLHDTERWEHIRASIEKYAKEKLVTDEGLSVDLYDGSGFNPASLAEWLEVRVLPAGSVRSFRHAGTNLRAEDARALIQVDVKVRRDEVLSGLSGNLRRPEELVDIVHDHFKEGREIPIYQTRSGGNPATQVGTLFVMRGEQQVLGDRKDEKIGGTLMWRIYQAIVRWDKLLDVS